MIFDANWEYFYAADLEQTLKSYVYTASPRLVTMTGRMRTYIKARELS